MEEEGRLDVTEADLRPQMIQRRDFRPFKTADEYLWAMKEDLSEWLNNQYPQIQKISPETFMACLETGVLLCLHANNVQLACSKWLASGKKLPKCWGHEWKLPNGKVVYNSNAKPETFYARDNVHNFITWCRQLGIFECLLFESDDLILRKNEKNVILCLLEVARRGSHFGMATPMLVKFEKEIDRDIAKDSGDLSSSGEEDESLVEYGPVPQIITNDLRSLDEMVRELVERCNCPTQFHMVRVAEGKYRIGNSRLMIYVRILRNHVMVRVGGGWDTLEHYLDKHDPCRCSAGHRAAVSSKLHFRNDGASPRMKVEYDRRDLAIDSPVHQSTPKKTADLSDSGSEISDEGYKTSDNLKLAMEMNGTSPAASPSVFPNNGHVSRKSSVSRTRSASIDEDRPDSRSTDEDSFLTPPKRMNPVTKSSSTSRVPNGRSVSTERSKATSLAPLSHRGTLCDSTNKQQVAQKASRANGTASSKHPPNVLQTRHRGHVRSLSASGSADFFSRRSSGSGIHQTPAPGPQKSQPFRSASSSRSSCGTTSNNGSIRGVGKGTWNGYGTGPRARTRPALHSDTYTPKRQNSDLGQTRTHEQSDLADSYGVGKSFDLASCIKKALEMDSDAEKILHIEQYLKQFEKTQNDECYLGGDQETVSLPYIQHPPKDITMAPLNKPLIIPKRKESGTTKIPKPNFY